MENPRISRIKELMMNAEEEFREKIYSYGPSFRVLSLPTIIDIIMYKLVRVSNVLRRKDTKVCEDVLETLINIANYAIIGQINLWDDNPSQITTDRAVSSYKNFLSIISHIQSDKDKDYNSAYLKMKNLSLVEIMQAKVERSIELLDKKECVSEIISDNLIDICNYAILTASKVYNEKAQ